MFEMNLSPSAKYIQDFTHLSVEHEDLERRLARNHQSVSRDLSKTNKKKSEG